MSNNYLIIGDDPYIREKEEIRLRDKFLSSSELDLNYSVFSSEEVSGIMDSLGTLPFLADKRVILVKDVHLISVESAASILTYLEKPTDTSVLVLSADSAFRKNKSYNKISKLTDAVNADKPDALTVKKWIRAFFKKENVEVSQDAVDLIVSLKGTDTAAVKIELDKLLAFSGGEKVEAPHVEKLVGRSVTETVFKLVDAINSKDTAWAFRILEDLYDQKQKHPVILGYLAWYTRMMQKIKLLASQGVSSGRMASEIGKSPGQTRHLEAQSRKYSPERIGKWISLLMEADEDLKKTSGKTPNLVMEILIVELINN